MFSMSFFMRQPDSEATRTLAPTKQQTPSEKSWYSKYRKKYQSAKSWYSRHSHEKEKQYHVQFIAPTLISMKVHPAVVRSIVKIAKTNQDLAFLLVLDIYILHKKKLSKENYQQAKKYLIDYVKYLETLNIGSKLKQSLDVVRSLITKNELGGFWAKQAYSLTKKIFLSNQPQIKTIYEDIMQGKLVQAKQIEEIASSISSICKKYT